MAAAITAILVVVGSFYFINPTAQTAPVNLFDSNFAPYMNNVSGMTRSAATDFGNRELAFAAYDNYNFNEASAYFDALLEVDEDASLLLYSGNAELSLGNADKAIARLSKLFNDYDAFDNQAAWYLSLAHLKNENAEEAAGYLLHLMATENSYSERATNLFLSMEESLSLLGNGTLPMEKAVVYDVRVDEFDGPPDGAEAMEAAEALSRNFRGRNAEWGVVITEKDGESLTFVNRRPLKLAVGTTVLVKKIPGRGRGVGAAIIIGTL
jgi:tetratricopeptide (TPR) repeat protein